MFRSGKDDIYWTCIEELAFADAVSLGNASRRTYQRWTKRINEILEENGYAWRVALNYDRREIRSYIPEEGCA